MLKNIKARLGILYVEEKAQDAFEYLLVVGGVSVAIVVATIVLAGAAPGIVGTVSGLITGVLTPIVP